jgi:hypothetical protein
MKKGVTMLVAAVAIFALIATIGSAAAAHYIWVDSDVKGVGYKNTEYEVDTVPGIATGIEMKELEAGSGLVTAQKWTLEVNGDFDGDTYCEHGLEEKKVFDVEYFPITYQNHSYDSKWQEKKCVKNYDIGAVTDANFVQCEKLQKEETLVTYGKCYTYNGDEGDVEGGESLSIVQTVTADVLGISHIGFAAKNLNDHHHTIAIGKEETVGNFHIEKTIDIRLACDEEQIGDWLGCP